MRLLFMDRKGISPLIATVLLIAFSVALGAVVMNWGAGFVDQQTEEVESTSDIQLQCSREVSLKIMEMNSAKQICYNSTHLRVLLTNTGTVNISSVQIVAIDSNDTISQNTISTALGTKSASSAWYALDIEDDSVIEHVKIIPIINVPGSSTNTVACSEYNLETDVIEACS